MRSRQIILEEARTTTDKIRNTDNQAVHDDLLAMLEVLLDMRDLLVSVEANTR